MINCIALDLDGTISDDRWRKWLLEGEDKDGWYKYFIHCDQDTLANQWILDSIKYDHNVIIVTSRPEYVREKTVSWLAKNGIRYNELLMRPSEVHIPAHEMKKIMIEESGHEFVRAYDDNLEVLSMYQSLGIPAIQVSID
jgi:uncharacterized HAD superfamily protein